MTTINGSSPLYIPPVSTVDKKEPVKQAEIEQKTGTGLTATAPAKTAPTSVSDDIKALDGKTAVNTGRVEKAGDLVKSVTTGETKDITALKGGTKAATGEQVTYPPTGKGNGDGKVVYFFSGYSGSEKDQKMWKSEQPNLVDDIAKLRANGYTVVVDPSGTKEEFKQAAYDSKTAGIYWTGHGFSGGVATNSGSMTSGDIDASKVSKNLRFCVFQSCNTGTKEKDWEKALGTDVIAWDRLTSTGEANDFATPNNSAYEFLMGDTQELDDLIDDRLVNKPWK